jgi:hypothetical protein
MVESTTLVSGVHDLDVGKTYSSRLVPNTLEVVEDESYFLKMRYTDCCRKASRNSVEAVAVC